MLCVIGLFGMYKTGKSLPHSMACYNKVRSGRSPSPKAYLGAPTVSYDAEGTDSEIEEYLPRYSSSGNLSSSGRAKSPVFMRPSLSARLDDRPYTIYDRVRSRVNDAIARNRYPYTSTYRSYLDDVDNLALDFEAARYRRYLP